ncbi:hypothetical protein Mal64_13560 [Pseudobythopirellula maris]|uniref:Uncharacterized protein n=1 Tax=Pseudobythopirellula maris TaxID=2527991 RepID=A0A5C5ZVC9_9BACT|nr:hypothetical protein [Pseudobythopirellula maris]TWT90957.1 hypothetical protein Mal64_13560 [Pseudobythopirellula maris]
MKTDDHDLETKIADQVRVMQVMTAAMVFCPMALAIIAKFVATGEEGPPNPLLVSVGMVGGLVMLFLQAIVGRLVTAHGIKTMADRARDEPEALAGAYQAGMIISLAFLEGAALFNLILYMMERSPYNLAMGAILFLSMAIKFPFATRIADWIRTQVKLIEEKKALGSE